MNNEEEIIETNEEETPEVSAVPDVPDPTKSDAYLRLAAEYDNYRRRTAAERANAYGEITANAVAQFLPLWDDLKLAVEHSDLSGLPLITKKFDEILAKLGVEGTADEPGTAFDPELHNAVGTFPDDKFGPGEITILLQKGFSIRGKVLRHSLVNVNP
ncbi:MAG: nucleotide exchange factor GrpE [Oscillospiraceae bacterium]|jgi:molecular chaperone GrpE|nr:nucleotide exchange factor GrpE [Oscillospiraceae bacterium]